MNLLQHCLLKLGEESGEIATALLMDESLTTGSGSLSNSKEINLEVNDLEAVIRKLRSEFDFNFDCFQSLHHANFADEHTDKNLSFWVMYTVKSCLALSKMTSKCIQFGLQEKHPDLNADNYVRLCCSLRDVFFGIDRLNTFGLGYSVDELHIIEKLEKIDHYLKYSISLNCVNDALVPQNLLPLMFKIITDEWGYSPHRPLPYTSDEKSVEGLEHSNSNTVIELPVSWNDLPIAPIDDQQKEVKLPASWNDIPIASIDDRQK
jgi:hypothetical protein